MPLDDTLRSLLIAQGPSGYETAPSAAWRTAAESFADDVSIDVMGNLTARVPGTASDSPTLAIVGHIDEIGLIVTHIDDKGRLFFIGVGGWDPPVLVSQRIDITTSNGVVQGVIGRKAVHLLEEDERKKGVELKELYIDIGARDGDEAKALVRIGDVAVIAGDPVELPNDRVAARALDNRLGAYIALEAARLVAEARGAAGGGRGGRGAGGGRRATSSRSASCRRRSGSTVRARSHTRCAPTSRSWSTSPTRPTPQGWMP